MTEQQTIDMIFALRVRNNAPWKRLLEIALAHAPLETKAVLREIDQNDKQISRWMSELANK